MLVANNEIRLRDGHPVQLARNGMVDWPALLGLMAAAADEGREPFAVAVRAQERLFTTRPITLGVEESLKHPDVPCGLKTDAERARHVRGRIKQFRNSAGAWEDLPLPREVPAGLVLVPRAVRDRVTEAAPDDGRPDLVPALTVQAALEKLGPGTLVGVGDGPAGRIYGRLVKVADVLTGDRVVLVKWLRRLTGWTGRVATLAEWEELIRPVAEEQLAR
ncbi:MAG TPA: DEAD/DEAH box helicase, partial [Verrucomicrobiota bacterium]|nr:DEAD/DEAH box helicase [Verrucomicrobiota bacterium]